MIVEVSEEVSAEGAVPALAVVAVQLREPQVVIENQESPLIVHWALVQLSRYPTPLEARLLAVHASVSPVGSTEFGPLWIQCRVGLGGPPDELDQLVARVSEQARSIFERATREHQELADQVNRPSNASPMR